MTEFTDLEVSALRAIFLETPELAPALERQLETSVVTERENSGGGFFTTIKVADDTSAVDSPSVLGYATQARIGGLEHGFGFVLFIKNGKLHMLEGFAWAPESTHDLDLAALQFEIYNQRCNGSGESPLSTNSGHSGDRLRSADMTPIEAFEPFAASLIGLPISHVWRGYGSAIFIECGKLQPEANRDGSTANPEGEVSLGVEWSWRIEDATAIRCGNWSEEDLWERAFDALRQARIARCELFGTLPEVAMTTESGVRFLSFSTTDGQPQWHLVDRRNGAPRWFTVREGQLHLGDGSEPAA